MCSLPFEIVIINTTRILLVKPESNHEKTIKRAIKKFFPDTQQPRFQLTGCQKMIHVDFDTAINKIKNDSEWKICALEIKEDKIWVNWI